MTGISAAQPAAVGRRFDWPGLVLMTVAALYLLTWWNRYLPPTNGVELTFAAETARGHVPYRDYLFVLPPGFVLAASAGVWLFGPHLIGFWFVGFLFRLAAVWCLYRWLCRIAPPPWAAFATLTAFVAACSDVADSPAFYNHYSLFFALLGGYAVVRSLETTERRGLPWAAAAGLCLACNFLNKQTTGILAGAATLASAAFAVGCLHGAKRSFRTVLIMILSAAFPCALAAGWLIHEGAWAAFIDQVFVSGPASKGSIGGSLARLGRTTLLNTELLGAWLLGLCAVSLLGVVAAGRNEGKSNRPRRLLWALTFACTTGAAYGLALLWGAAETTSRGVMLAAAAMGMLTCLGAALWALTAVVRGARDSFTLQLGLLGGVGFASALALALSWPLFEPMAWPGLGLALALVFRFTDRVRAPVFRTALVVASVLLIGCGAWRKYEWPNTWGHWYEPPVVEATREPSVPGLRGFRLSPGTATMFDDVTRLVQSHSRPDEPILVFPHMPIFYALADRPLSTFSYMHWIDVCPDTVADRDARTLQAAPPAVIVLMDLGPDGVRTEETAFRSGQESGQQRLRSTIHDLLPRYELVGNFPVPQDEKQGEKQLSVQVWARRPGTDQSARAGIVP